MSSDAEKILEKILDETHIVLSALDVRNFDVAETALEKRQELIENLERIENKKKTPQIEKMLFEFQELDALCRKALMAFEEEMTEEFEKTKMEQRNLQKNKKAHNYYQMQTPDQYTGASIDHKK